MKNQILFFTALALVIAFCLFRQKPLPEGVRLKWMSGGYHALVEAENKGHTIVVPADVQWAKGKLSLIRDYALDARCFYGSLGAC